MHATLPDGTTSSIFFYVTLINSAAAPTCNSDYCTYTQGVVTLEDADLKRPASSMVYYLCLGPVDIEVSEVLYTSTNLACSQDNVQY